MNEHVKQAEAEQEAAPIDHADLEAAMAAMQAEVVDPLRDQEVNAGKLKFKYADLEGVLKAIRPVLKKHGLWISRHTEIQGGNIVMIAQMRHVKGGKGEAAVYPVSGLNASHQQIGAGMTYAQRRLDSLVTGIASTDDNDAQGTADLGEGPKVKMSAHQAKKEVNWEEIQKTIDTAPTFEKLVNLAARVDANKGIWPDSYVSIAKERLTIRRLAIADEKMSKAADVDELNDMFGDLEVILDELVVWDELAGLHKKHEKRILG